MCAAPIGVFDSGVGGLSVLRHIRNALPGEHLLYVADSAYAPYGPRTAGQIQARSLSIASYLVEQGAKALVIACNTATAAAATDLRSRFALPILGMEPAVKPAVAATRSGVIGVLATSGTLQSAQFAALLENYGKGVHVVTCAAPGLVEAVERGECDSLATRELLGSFLRPMLDDGADTLVLGCTHYPFLQPFIEEVTAGRMRLIETGPAVAKHLKRRLEEERLLSAEKSGGTERFLTSGNTEQAGTVMARLWGRALDVAPLPASAC